LWEEIPVREMPCIFFAPVSGVSVVEKTAPARSRSLGDRVPERDARFVAIAGAADSTAWRLEVCVARLSADLGGSIMGEWVPKSWRPTAQHVDKPWRMVSLEKMNERLGTQLRRIIDRRSASRLPWSTPTLTPPRLPHR